jgi:predicted nucleotidyltransferase
MTEEICRRLELLQADRGVRVLYACESGSRAWGFASPDSDYDVRFIYAHDLDWYLSVEDHRDVIEIMDGDLDLSGWDLRKSLKLLRKSNPALIEWLSSPIVYSADSTFLKGFREVSNAYFSPERCFRHYLHMAEGNFRGYLQGETVWTKKYLYVLRPVLACIWIERGFGAAPMEFSKLVEGVVDDPRLLGSIETLLERKMKGAELASGPRDEYLSGFIESELIRLAAKPKVQETLPDPEGLNEFFRRRILRS